MYIRDLWDEFGRKKKLATGFTCCPSPHRESIANSSNSDEFGREL